MGACGLRKRQLRNRTELDIVDTEIASIYVPSFHRLDLLIRQLISSKTTSWCIDFACSQIKQSVGLSFCVIANEDEKLELRL